MKIQNEDGTLTIEAYTALRNIAGLSPKELRHRAYNSVPENLAQLQKWKRGELIATVFDAWIKQNRHMP